MDLQVGKSYVLDGRVVKCVAATSKPIFVLEFQDCSPVYDGVFNRETISGQSNQFVVCATSPIVKEMKE